MGVGNMKGEVKGGSGVRDARCKMRMRRTAHTFAWAGAARRWRGVEGRRAGRGVNDAPRSEGRRLPRNWRLTAPPRQHVLAWSTKLPSCICGPCCPHSFSPAPSLPALSRPACHVLGIFARSPCTLLNTDVLWTSNFPDKSRVISLDVLIMRATALHRDREARTAASMLAYPDDELRPLDIIY